MKNDDLHMSFEAQTNAETDKNDITYMSDIPLMLWYDKAAPITASEHKPRVPNGTDEVDEAWEKWSLPIGNGYFGVNVFGRTETERIQITEKTLVNPHSVKDGETMYIVGGTNSFSETFIDFGHTEFTDYKRYLNLKTAISGVEYTSCGIKYTREYFTSYPDRALVIRLDADKSGALSFTLRPTIPYKQSYGGFAQDGITKIGTVYSRVTNGIGEIELSGNMGFYGVDFLGIYKVYTDGGTITASTTERSYKDTDGTVKTDTDGTIAVNGAKSAYIIVTLGTDYKLHSDVFVADETTKPTKSTTLDDARVKVEDYMNAITSKISGKSFEEAYQTLKDSHIADYSSLFGRVSLNLGCKKSDFDLTTDALIADYKNDSKSAYLETLIFQYGRYLLISSSRDGSLPANLQGVWNTYNVPAWACDYTHNINVQMNYWPAFSTNLAETFKAYVDYNAAYMKQAEINADSLINQYNPDAYGKDGGNGWVLGDHTTAYKYTGHRSAGNLGFMTQLFWDWYEYTKDLSVLRYVYNVLVNAARYITKCVHLDANGNYLITHCDSPEMYVNGVWYYTEGTTYAQSFAYLNNYYALETAKVLGIELTDSKLLSTEEYSILRTIIEQIDKYDPINVGLSGQIKEFREEDYYCSVGDEYHHRHVAQLVGLHPGTLINSTTPAWLDAAKVTLTERGDAGTGWSISWKMNLWARIKDGERAYRLLHTLLKDKTAYNLWTLHPPFQIDGNFGATAGISEMLLQSHEGYIAPLTSMTSNWKNGSYSGLVARGGFVISAEWKNGFAKTLRITSTAGGTASLYYPSAADANVINTGGKEISFSVIGKDLISFETTVGETYTISGFKEIISPNAPTELKCEKCENGTKLSWEASADAESYNVYIAVENEPAYTLVGTTVRTEFTYGDDKLDSSARATFAITAVSNCGNESKRALIYRNPRIVTEYGIIPEENSDVPFALFLNRCKEYSYLGSFYNYFEALRELAKTKKNESDSISAVIYVTKNTDIYTPSGAFTHLNVPTHASITIDLAKRSLVLKSTFLDVDTAEENVFDFKIKNGKILTASHSAINVYSSKSHSNEDRKCTIEFENVTFGKERYHDETVPIFTLAKETKNNGLKIEVLLNDCTVDYISNKETESVTLFDFAEENEAPVLTVKFKGGNVKLQSLRTLPLFNGKYDERIVFEENKNSEKTYFKLTDGEAPDLTFKTDSGEQALEFVKREKIHYTVYTHYVLASKK